MKTMILMASILCLSMSFAACSDDNSPVITDKNLNETTTFFSSTEPNNYTTYYKPYVGYVGDPMPFFDPVSKEFRILYLQDDRDGNSTIYHLSTNWQLRMWQTISLSAKQYHAEQQ